MPSVQPRRRRWSQRVKDDTDSEDAEEKQVPTAMGGGRTSKGDKEEKDNYQDDDEDKAKDENENDDEDDDNEDDDNEDDDDDDELEEAMRLKADIAFQEKTGLRWFNLVNDEVRDSPMESRGYHKAQSAKYANLPAANILPPPEIGPIKRGPGTTTEVARSIADHRGLRFVQFGWQWDDKPPRWSEMSSAAALGFGSSLVQTEEDSKTHRPTAMDMDDSVSRKASITVIGP
ncbi:hypothetical protein QFC19_000676 [Naganishia cerealis]|uniref:Uncharacterized protein n=1 Tax=Naganishia cerealis TaxID=610337 RepID=A0ACC2WMH8_9TREE|nr:hypothetical protein QFC19_000676 [Naganishia cerealis]